MGRLAERAAKLAAEVRTREAGRAGEVVHAERLEVAPVGEILGTQQVSDGRQEKHGFLGLRPDSESNVIAAAGIPHLARSRENGFMAVDRSTENERERHVRDLEAAVVAMREALELADRGADDRLQAAVAAAASEADQLKAMITTLREELEAQDQRHAEELQRQRQQAADEVRQLQATIQALRKELERA
jgi:hypothetical protein